MASKAHRRQTERAKRALAKLETVPPKKGRSKKQRGMSDYQKEKVISSPQRQGEPKQTKAEKKKEREYSTHGYPQPKTIDF